MTRRPTTFAGRTAVVTGGASGIGRALGAALRARGAHVVLADIESAAADVAATTIEAAAPPGGSTTGAALDVRDRDGWAELVGNVVDTHGHLDLLFNNAGISVGGPVEGTPPEHWDRVIDVNLRGVVNGVIATYPTMIRQGRGHIVNTASAAGLAPAVFVAPYATTKFGVVGLSTSLRPEAAARGVRVSVLCPGMVETPILDAVPAEDLPARSGRTLTAREYLETIGLRPISAERFATIALRGVAANRGLIVAPRSVAVGWWLARLSPRSIDGISRLLAGRIRRRLGDDASDT